MPTKEERNRAEKEARETQRRLLDQQRSKKFLKSLRDKATDSKNVSPVSNITRASKAREELYKQFQQGYNN